MKPRIGQLPKAIDPKIFLRAQVSQANEPCILVDGRFMSTICERKQCEIVNDFKAPRMVGIPLELVQQTTYRYGNQKVDN